MVKITDKLNIIKNAKDDIKASIEAKGVEVGNVSIEEYPSKINEIPSPDEELVASFKSSIDDTLGSNCTKLPEGITLIGQYAFYHCTNLALTKLPDALTSIGYSAFYGCEKMAITEVPSGVTSIPYAGLRQCRGITNLTLLGNINVIDNMAFAMCSNLSKFVMPNITKVPTLDNAQAFTGTPIKDGTGYIYVPDSLVESFKSATNWSTYANQIKGLSEMEA